MRSLAVGLGLLSWVGLSAAVADDPPGRGVSGPPPVVRGLSPTSRLPDARGAGSAARGRIPGRGPEANARTVGPNFRPQRDARGLTRPGMTIGERTGIAMDQAQLFRERAERYRERGDQQENGDRGRDLARIARGFADDVAADGKDGEQREADGVVGSRRPTIHPQHLRLMLQADLVLARRLADIDRLRDVALANGNENLLLRADQLEQQARLQHDQRIARIEAFPTAGREIGEGANPGLASQRLAAPGRELPETEPLAVPTEPTSDLPRDGEPYENPAAKSPTEGNSPGSSPESP